MSVSSSGDMARFLYGGDSDRLIERGRFFVDRLDRPLAEATELVECFSGFAAGVAAFDDAYLSTALIRELETVDLGAVKIEAVTFEGTDFIGCLGGGGGGATFFVYEPWLEGWGVELLPSGKKK